MLALVHGVLGPDLVAAYLHGSAVLGGSVPTSDLDVLVVSRRATTIAERRRLVASLLSLSAPPADEPEPNPERRPIELTMVVASDVRPWRFPPPMDFQYGDWHRAAYQRGEIPNESPNPDLATLTEAVRRGGVTLVGPPPTELLDPVPAADLAAAMVAGLEGLLVDLPGDTRNVVLTLCRMWRTLATGDIVRKDEAAAWVAARLDGDDRAVVERARELYLAGRYGPWGSLDPAIGATAARLATEVRRLAAASHGPIG